MLHAISLNLLVLQLLWIFSFFFMFLIKSLFSFQRYIRQREQCCRKRRQQNEWGYIAEECRMTKRLFWKKEISSSKMNADKSVEQFIADLRKNGTYADHIVVEYTSRTLADLAITVVMETSDTVIGKPDAGTPSLYIGYIPRLPTLCFPSAGASSCNACKQCWASTLLCGRVVRPQSSLRDFSTVKFLHQRMDNCVLLGPRRMI